VDGIATEEATQAESTEATDTASTAAPSTTPTSEATDTPEPTATATSTPTETPTQTPEPEVFALIVASQAVNIREGPGRDFAPIGVVQPDTRVQVLDESEDGEWTQIRLDDGTEGWVSSALLEIEEPEASLPALNLGFSVRVGWGAALPQVNQQPEPTTIPPTEVNISRPHRDERWYGMTTGIIAIVLIIFIGNVMSLIRRAMRNRRRA
jgi:uncharacterized protein YgiM (DUF1202 family)